MRVLTINELLSYDTKRTLRSRGAHRRRPSDLPRRIAWAHRGAHQPAQHPLGAGAAKPAARLGLKVIVVGPFRRLRR